MIALLIRNSRRHLCWQNQPSNHNYSYLITLPNEVQINQVLLWEVKSSQRKVQVSLSSQPCKNTHFLSLKICTHSSCRNGGRGFLNDLKKRARIINKIQRRNERKTGNGSLSQSTLLMEFGVCGVSSFSDDGLFPSTSFPATKKTWFKTSKILCKTMAHHGLRRATAISTQGKLSWARASTPWSQRRIVSNLK